MNLFQKIKNIIQHRFQNQKINKQEQKTILLKERQVSDVERWSKDNELHPNWNQRTELLASYIKPNSAIIEFGAGVMHLKQLVKDYSSYTPSDIVQRYPETIVCDLNLPITLDLSKYNVAIFSGVLEYVYNVDSVFFQLRESRVPQVILSYCCIDLVNQNRERNGWLSDFSKKQIEEIFNNNNYKVIDYQEWNNQSIYNLELKN